MSEDTGERVREILADFTGMEAGDIVDDLPIVEITNGDRNKEGELILSLQQNLGIELDGHAIERFQAAETVGDLIELMKSLLDDVAVMARVRVSAAAKPAPLRRTA